MRTNNPAERIALNPKRQTKPVLYWEAFRGNTVVDQDNSVALLRYKWQHDKTIIFKAKR